MPCALDTGAIEVANYNYNTKIGIEFDSKAIYVASLYSNSWDHFKGVLKGHSKNVIYYSKV